MNRNYYPRNAFTTFILILGLIAVTRFTDIKPFLGSLETKPTSTITVSGTAKKDEANQIANFTVGMESIEESKDEALNKVNDAMNQVIAQVKDFGIDSADIQTENASVYQETEYIETSVTSSVVYPRGDAQKGDWRANGSLSIKLRNVDQANELLDILNNSEANFVNGPNFTLEDREASANDLLSQAVTNAREKAEAVASANNQTVGKIISLTESGVNNIYPAYESSMLATGSGLSKSVIDAELEPGSTTTSKSVTVVFELN